MTLPDHFSVSSDPSPGVVTVIVSGEVDLDTAPTVRDEVLRHLHGGAAVHLDLGDVTFMDSSGLHVLLATSRRAALVGAELRLVRVSVRVQRLIELTGTQAVLEQPPAKPEAGGPYVPAPSADASSTAHSSDSGLAPA
jgi:anti-sigma B factor antagonist